MKSERCHVLMLGAQAAGSHDQAEQLERPAARLERSCIDARFTDVEVITDMGSGLNYRRKELQQPAGRRSAWTRSPPRAGHEGPVRD